MSEARQSAKMCPNIARHATHSKSSGICVHSDPLRFARYKVSELSRHSHLASQSGSLLPAKPNTAAPTDLSRSVSVIAVVMLVLEVS